MCQQGEYSTRCKSDTHSEEQGSVGCDLLDNLPESTLGNGIHGRRGLVQDQNGGLAHQRDSEAELSLVPPGELRGERVGVGGQVEPLHDMVDIAPDIPDALDAGVKGEVVPSAHEIESIVLRAHCTTC